jgi:hypothetical protein
MRLVRLLMAGELHSVAVPTLEEEGLRDLVRARKDLARRVDERAASPLEAVAAPRRAL